MIVLHHAQPGPIALGVDLITTLLYFSLEKPTASIRPAFRFQYLGCSAEDDVEIQHPLLSLARVVWCPGTAFKHPADRDPACMNCAREHLFKWAWERYSSTGQKRSDVLRSLPLVRKHLKTTSLSAAGERWFWELLDFFYLFFFIVIFQSEKNKLREEHISTRLESYFFLMVHKFNTHK